MRKLAKYLLLAIPAMLAFTSCDDSGKELPQVIMNVNYSNASQVNGILYVVQGDTLKVDSITLTKKPNTKNAAILRVGLGINGFLTDYTTIPPFAMQVPTESLDTGRYVMTIQGDVVQVGKSPAVALIATKLKVVADAGEVPPTDTPSNSINAVAKVKSK